MMKLRLCGLIGLLLLAAAVIRATPQDLHRLADERFRDWIILQSDITDLHISQIWRQPLSNLPKGIDGYQMVSYQVQQTESPPEAARKTRELLQKQRFSDYIAQGYDVTANSWAVGGRQAVQFVVSGINHNTTVMTVQHAEIFTFALAQDNLVIWLEVRQVNTTQSLELADHALEKAGGRELAETLVGDVLALWYLTPDKHEPLTHITPTPPVPAVKPSDVPAIPATPAPVVKAPDAPTTPAVPAPVVKPRMSQRPRQSRHPW